MRIFATPISVDVDDVPPALQMELIELQSSDALCTKFGELGLKEFYRHIKDDCPNLKMYAAKKMALFGSTYICEQYFSKMNYMKSSFRTSITDTNFENGMNVAMTSFVPDFRMLVRKTQSQSSH